jgi:hypothetical protein
MEMGRYGDQISEAPPTNPFPNFFGFKKKYLLPSTSHSLNTTISTITSLMRKTNSNNQDYIIDKSVFFSLKREFTTLVCT